MTRIRLQVDAPDVPEIVDGALADAPEMLGEEMVDALQSAGSFWPVRTGYSKEHFGHVVDGDQARLTNEAEYAPLVENRTKGAETTLRARENEIAERVDKHVEERL